MQTNRIDPWRVEIVVVRDGSRSATERSALHRDEVRGLVLRLGRGAHVERGVFEALTPEGRHVVRMRALAATASGQVVFSHWSAAVLHGLPVLRSRLSMLHTTVAEPGLRSGSGVTGHVFSVREEEVVALRGLQATSPARTVVDVAGAAPFEEGVMVADGALRAGAPRALLEAAIELAGPRRAGRRICEAVGFAHPGAESAAESRFRVTLMRCGFEVPVLQYRIVLLDGSNAFLDALLPHSSVGVEVDGDRKYLDPALAPEGAGRVVLAEKRREDEVRTHLRGLARIGWVQAGSTLLLAAALDRVGARPPRTRCTLADYIASAASARPRFPSVRPPARPDSRPPAAPSC